MSCAGMEVVVVVVVVAVVMVVGEGVDLLFTLLPRAPVGFLIWDSLGNLVWGPPGSLLVSRCLRDAALGAVGLKNRSTDDNGRHDGCCVSCTASLAGSVRVSAPIHK